MLLENINNNITNPNYDFFTAEKFLGFEDLTRFIIIIFIFLSFLLNLFIFFTIFYYKSKKQMSFSGIITCNILIINFLHTLSYIFNWVLKSNETETNIGNVGALLIGNPSNIALCSLQGCFLIFFSLCQEILNNLLLGYIIWNGKENKPIFILIFILLGYIFPACFVVLFFNFGFIGINEKYCYFAKYDIKLENGLVNYIIVKNYDICQGVLISLRSLNLIITILFLIKGIIYINKTNNKDHKKEALISSFPTAIVIFLTSFIEIIFRILFIISSKIENKCIGIYLILNTIDSFLLPLSFIIVYKLYQFWFCRDNDKNNDLDNSFQDSLLPEEQK